MSELPEGFVLDQSDLPEGFVIDSGAQEPPTKPRNPDTGRDMLEEHFNHELAARQRVSPVVRDSDGNFIHKHIGEYVNLDGRELIETPSGELIEPGGKYIVLQDHVTGKFLGFERTHEEPRLLSAGRLLLPGMVTASPAIGATSKAANVASRTTRQDNIKDIPKAFKDAQVEPSLLTTSRSPMLDRVGNTLKEVPAGGMTTRKGVQRTFDQVDKGFKRVTDKFGGADDLEATGSNVQSNIQKFAKGSAIDEADNIIARPSSQTNIKTKQGALYNRVDKLVPEETAINLSGTREAFNSLLGKFSTSQLAELETLRKGGGTLKRIEEALKGVNGISYKDARNLRTLIGKLTEGAEGISKADANKIYSALTSDIMASIPAKAGDAMRRADQFTAAAHKRIKESLGKVLNAKNGEQAFQKIMTAAKGSGSGDVKMLMALKRSLGKNEWDEVASTLIHKLVEKGPVSFATNYDKLSPRARGILFTGPGGRTKIGKELHALYEVSKRLNRFDKMRNFSGTGGVGISFAQGVAFTQFNFLTAAAIAGAEAMGYVMTSPRVLRWLTNTQKMIANRKGLPLDGVMVRQLGALRQIAANSNGQVSSAVLKVAEAIEQELWAEGDKEKPLKQPQRK